MSNAGQVKEIEERVFSLSDILRSPLRGGDNSERARRELLRRLACSQSRSSLPLTQDIRRRLMDVLEKLEPLSNKRDY